MRESDGGERGWSLRGMNAIRRRPEQPLGVRYGRAHGCDDCKQPKRWFGLQHTHQHRLLRRHRGIDRRHRRFRFQRIKIQVTKHSSQRHNKYVRARAYSALKRGGEWYRGTSGIFALIKAWTAKLLSDLTRWIRRAKRADSSPVCFNFLRFFRALQRRNSKADQSATQRLNANDQPTYRSELPWGFGAISNSSFVGDTDASVSSNSETLKMTRRQNSKSADHVIAAVRECSPNQSFLRRFDGVLFGSD